MPLDRAKVAAHVGAHLELQPIYGWGWHPRFPWEHLPKDVLPPRIRFRLTDLVEFGNAVVGGVGSISEPPTSEPLSGWLCFELRQQGQYDFERSIGVYNISVDAKRPISSADERIWDHADWLGYGFVGVAGWPPPW